MISNADVRCLLSLTSIFLSMLGASSTMEDVEKTMTIAMLQCYVAHLGGKACGYMRKEAAEFVSEMKEAGFSLSDIRLFMQDELSLEHCTLYEGSLLGGQRAGDKRTEAALFI